MSEQQVEKPQVQNARPYLTFEDKLEHLQEIGVSVKDKSNRMLVNNIYNAVTTMQRRPDTRTSTMLTNSETTLLVISKAKQIDTIMGNITAVIKGFDTPGRAKYSSMEKIKKAFDDHEYFEARVEEVAQQFNDIMKEATEKGYYRKKGNNRQNATSNNAQSDTKEEGATTLNVAGTVAVAVENAETTKKSGKK